MYEPMSDVKGLTVSILVIGLKLMKADRVDAPYCTNAVIIGLQAASITAKERFDPTETVTGSMGVLQSYGVAKGIA